MRLAVVGCLVLCGLSTQVAAATLEVKSGTVSVNHGGGFKNVSGIVDVQTNDRVLIEQGSSATLIFADGCIVKFPEAKLRSLFTVSGPDLCIAENTIGPDTATIATGVIAGGAIITGVVLAASGGSSSSKPASP